MSGGQGFVCRFQGSRGAQLIVSDVPNTSEMAICNSKRRGGRSAGKRHTVSIGGARGYYEPKRFGTSGSIGVAFYVTYHRYLIGVGVVGVSVPRAAAREALIKVLKKRNSRSLRIRVSRRQNV